MQRHKLQSSAWAERIRAKWAQSVQAVVEVGRELLAAKEALPHGQFQRMVKAELSFGTRTAQCLMALARHPVIANTQYAARLPSSWFTLSVLAQLESDHLISHIEAGKVHPAMQQNEAVALCKSSVAPDEVPIPQLHSAVTQPGDLWQLGDHRLLCGSATSEADVVRLLNGERADLCLSDPPWGLEVEYDGYDDNQENLKTLVDGFFPLARQHSDVMLITPGNANQRLYPAPDWTLAWQSAGGRASSKWGFINWQPILAYGDDPFLHPKGHHRKPSRRPDAIFDSTPREKATGHPCPKPLAPWIKILQRGSASRGDSIFDPFAGFGTTILAAHATYRRAFAIEQSPRYCDLTVQRWETISGRKAKRVQHSLSAAA